MYENGRGIPKNNKTAVKWYSLAAEQEIADAQFNLGVMYDNGKGVPQDYKTAVKWYSLAAEQGYAPAQYNLKRLERPITEQNKLQELQTPAKQGNADAQYKLGAIYGNGQGVIQGNVYAHTHSLYPSQTFSVRLPL
jgi:TPR repeat protein